MSRRPDRRLYITSRNARIRSTLSHATRCHKHDTTTRQYTHTRQRPSLRYIHDDDVPSTRPFRMSERVRAGSPSNAARMRAVHPSHVCTSGGHWNGSRRRRYSSGPAQTHSACESSREANQQRRRQQTSSTRMLSLAHALTRTHTAHHTHTSHQRAHTTPPQPYSSNTARTERPHARSKEVHADTHAAQQNCGKSVYSRSRYTDHAPIGRSAPSTGRSVAVLRSCSQSGRVVPKSGPPSGRASSERCRLTLPPRRRVCSKPLHQP